MEEIGSLCGADHDRCYPDDDLLSPLKIRGVEIRNRIAVSPMCQYIAKEGFPDDWHLVHLGSRAVGGAGIVFTEATAVTPEGRISPGDLGIYDDAHIEPFKRIASFIHRMGAVAGIQLAHAGRKGSCKTPWEGGAGILPDRGGWKIVAPSPIPFSDKNPMPQELDKKGIDQVVQDFIAATKRALAAGFKIIEIHAAHGYLLHSFLSPLSNKRRDEYGGSLQNRMRIVSEVVKGIRSVIPSSMPLFIRISATDWVDGGWGIEESVELAKTIKPLGIDLVDVSSGGLVPNAKIPTAPNYQVPFSEEMREKAGVLTGAVGLIKETHQANDIITSGKADVIFIAREFLREPYWALKAEKELQQEPNWPISYGYAVHRK